MAKVIKIKQSAVASKVPLAADLQQGELALNTFDEKLYTKNSSGNVVEIGGGPQFFNQETLPTSPNSGDTWYDPSEDTLYMWAVSKWMLISVALGTSSTTYDGGDALNPLYTETIDGGDATTITYTETIDGGLA